MPDARATEIEALGADELAQHEAADLPNREVMSLIDPGLLSVAPTTGGTAPSSDPTGGTGGATGTSDPLGLTGSDGSTPSAADSPMGQSLTGGLQAGSQTAADGSSLAQGPVSDAAAGGATQPYSPEVSSVSQT